MKIGKLLAASISATSANAIAGFGGMANIGDDTGGSFDLSALPVLLAGAAIGYWAERTINRWRLDRQGDQYSSEYLGGKLGAIIGAIALPIAIGLFR